jgi:hypothetical protein
MASPNHSKGPMPGKTETGFAFESARRDLTGGLTAGVEEVVVVVGRSRNLPLGRRWGRWRGSGSGFGLRRDENEVIVRCPTFNPVLLH